MYRSATAQRLPAFREPERDPAALPAEAPLMMPVQDLSTAPSGVVHGRDPLLARRLILTCGALAIGLFGAQEMTRPMFGNGIEAWDLVLGLLFFLLFAWIGFGFISALAGFTTLVARGPRLPRWLGREHRPRERTALLVPIYNEELEPLQRRLRLMADSVAGAGLADRFDLFILSDSGASAESAERAMAQALARHCAMAVHYRRRPQNIARKPGNIAEWVQRFGAAYPYMVVLDADSLMSGKALARLAATMDADPRIGLIQSIPAIHQGRTLLARWQQFCAHAYGPVASAGLIWWSGTEATFWGHNAILRTRAFAESCGLPVLSGSGPFGGHIQSHDMFEAALLRRRGWAVHMIQLPEGSLEEAPPTLPDLATRDRRWCQGNLQHLRLLGTAGLHWISRLQLLMGAAAYLAAPLWLMLLLASLVEPFRSGGWSLSPTDALLGLTILLLIGPKLLALGWLALDDDLRASLGGGWRVAATTLIEIPLSMLIAPILMLTHTLAILDIVRGRRSGWAPQRRDADGIDPRDAWRRYRAHVGLGALFLVAMLAGIESAVWILPVATGLLAAPLIAMATARIDLGDRLAAQGLFLAPGECPAPEKHPLDFAPVHGLGLVTATP